MKTIIDNRLLFALIISILLVFSVGSVFAGDNETISDVVSTPCELEETTLYSNVGDVQAIFFNTQEDFGSLPIEVDVSQMPVCDTAVLYTNPTSPHSAYNFLKQQKKTEKHKGR